MRKVCAPVSLHDFPEPGQAARLELDQAADDLVDARRQASAAGLERQIDALARELGAGPAG